MICSDKQHLLIIISNMCILFLDAKTTDDVSSIFFDLESEINETNSWRDICTSPEHEKSQ